MKKFYSTNGERGEKKNRKENKRQSIKEEETRTEGGQKEAILAIVPVVCVSHHLFNPICSLSWSRVATLFQTAIFNYSHFKLPSRLPSHAVSPGTKLYEQKTEGCSPVPNEKIKGVTR